MTTDRALEVAEAALHEQRRKEGEGGEAKGALAVIREIREWLNEHPEGTLSNYG